MVLKAYWPLDEASGEAVDVRNGNNGSLNGGVTQGVAGIVGGKACDFNGSGGYIDVSTTTYQNGGPWSVNIWFNADSVSGPHNFVSDDDGGADDNIGFQYLCIYDDGGNVPPSLAIWDHGPGTWRFADTEVSTGKWCMATFVYDGSGTVFFYLNGNPDGKGALNQSYEKAVMSVIGAYGSTTDRFFDGRLSDLRIYDHALTQSEVQYLYQVGKRGLYTSSKRNL